MPKFNVPIVLLVSVLFCLPWLALATDADRDHHARAETPRHIELSAELRILLNREMALIQQGTMQLVPAISAGDWEGIAKLGGNIKASFILEQELTAAQQEELQRRLPERFVEMDRDFHLSAGLLARAAKQRDGELVSFYFYRMTSTCVSCHARFARERFPGFAGGGGETEHHH